MNNAELIRLREENDELRERVRQLEEHLGWRFTSPSALGLTATHDIVLGCMMSRSVAREEFILEALYYRDPSGGTADDRIVDVFIYHMRKRLKPHGIAIYTERGVGYYLNADGKKKIQELLYATARTRSAA
jgi:two-component system cell cycle response regulator CtrA